MAAVILLVGCEIGEEIVTPSGTPQLVLHAVFNPNASSQAILLERAWDGRRFVFEFGQSYDPSNPIFTGGGIPELHAEVHVTLPHGAVVRAVELTTPLGQSIGDGMYRLPVTGDALRNGGRFDLHIRSAAGEIVTSQMTLPDFPQPASVPIETLTFDARRDTIHLTWDPVSGARAYQVVVENTIRSLTVFTESTFVRLPGTIRHTQLEGLPATFLPGFVQQVAVLAVDTNYYDYYRSSNSANTGRGLVNRIQGGLGVFGAAAPIVRRRLQVHAAFEYPVEGVYHFLGTPQELTGTLLRSLTINVSARGQASDGLSGGYTANSRFPLFPLADTAGTFVGRRWKDSIEVAILSLGRWRDTIDVFKARVSGDTLIGRYRLAGGTATLVKTNPIQ
jgi:hypothetical protein